MHVGIWAEILLAWCGPVRELCASHKVWVDQRPNRLGGTYQVSIPDSVSVLASFASGAQGVLQWSAVALHAPAETVELYGSEGTIVYQPSEAYVMAGRRGDSGLRKVEVPEDERNEWTVEANFIDAIRDGVPVQTSFYDGLRYMEFVEAIYRSHESGAMVRFPLSS